MSAFPVDAALEGFRFTREQPRAILPWAALSLASGLAEAAILIVSGAQGGLESVAAASKGPLADPETLDAAVSALAAVLPGLAVKSALGTVVAAVLACSAFRVLLGRDAHARLAFGRDELRMGGLLLTFGLINLLMLGFTSAATTTAGLAAGGADGVAGALASGLVAVLGALVQAYVMVRLALASPMSVGEGRWSFAESWRRTAGRFWPMLGALLITALLYTAVVFLVSQLFGRVATLVRLAEGSPAVPADLRQLMDPAVLVVEVGIAVAVGLGVPILAAPLAVAYKRFR